MASHLVDARYSTTNNVGRDQIVHNYALPPIESRLSNWPPSSLSFNDAPIDLLSSHFTGREEELNHIAEVLCAGQGNVPARYVVHGMQGLGKTQLALKYAELSFRRQQYSAIFWISGASVEKLHQGFTKVLYLVGHPDRDTPEQGIKLTLARRWLEEHITDSSFKWLLVVDNVAQEAVGFLREHFPRKNASGNILLTTRTRDVAQAVTTVAGQRHQIVELRAPDLQCAALLLLREAGINTNDTDPTTIDRAETLVKCVGCLPLAISHAASFAQQSNKNLEDVLLLYQSKHKYEVCFCRHPSFFLMLNFCGLQ